MEQNRLMLGFGKVAIFFVLAVVVLAGVAGIFYYIKVYTPNHAKSEPPKLFSKGDYKVVDRTDGQYIVVDKVGLTAKVPTGWRVEFEGQDKPDGTSQYWVNLMSQDAEVLDILIKGCSISVISGNSEENFNETKNNVELIQKNPQNSNGIRAGYVFSIKNFGNKSALKWNGPEKPIIGQVFGIDIPIREGNVLSFETRMLPDFKEKCFSIWENFVKSIVIK